MPSKPELYTKSPFKGPIVHTAEWDHSLDLKGKTVAVIGTGASAVQVVPSIVDTVKSLEVFQRNSPWTVMRGQIAYESHISICSLCDARIPQCVVLDK
jgi:cation diffusion facilitator CzcD-associated flavoprotein CzcO